MQPGVVWVALVFQDELKIALDQIDHDTSDSRIDNLMQSMRMNHGIGVTNPRDDGGMDVSHLSRTDKELTDIPLPLFVLFMFKFKQFKNAPNREADGINRSTPRDEARDAVSAPDFKVCLKICSRQRVMSTCGV